MRVGAETQTSKSDPLWPLWKRLVGEFGFSAMMRQVLTSRSGWGFWGVDVVTTLRTTRMAERAVGVLADASVGDLDRLAALAAVNARRNEAMWRAAALFYVTVPVTLFLAGLEGAPDAIKRMFDEGAIYLGFVIGLLTLWLLGYFANQWRARQVEAVIELARIERDVWSPSRDSSTGRFK